MKSQKSTMKTDAINIFCLGKRFASRDLGKARTKRSVGLMDTLAVFPLASADGWDRLRDDRKSRRRDCCVLT